MNRNSKTALALCLALTWAGLYAGGAHAAKPPRKSEADIIKASAPEDWRPLDPMNTLLMNIKGTPVIIELAPQFAPAHVDNIRKLARNGYYSASSVIRVQDNYVVQWGDPAEDDKDKTKAQPLRDAKPTLPAEFSIPYKGLALTKLGDADGWAPVTGFAGAMPVAANPAKNQAWIAHCYGVVGSGRDAAPDSSNATSLYAIIGQAPRRLDLNITVVGRVLKGMEVLSALPRGPEPMGFYDKPEMQTPLGQVRLLADVPEAERPALEVMRTDTATWKAMLDATRNPGSDWFAYRPGHTNVCNRSIPTRALKAG